MSERDDLGRIIWDTSRADESAISATGANIVADAILAAGWRPPATADHPTEPSAHQVWAEGYMAHADATYDRYGDIDGVQGNPYPTPSRVEPTTDDWTDPKPWYIDEIPARYSQAEYASWEDSSTSANLAEHRPRTREQHEAELANPESRDSRGE